jgi:hypothetical protein
MDGGLRSLPHPGEFLHRGGELTHELARLTEVNLEPLHSKRPAIGMNGGTTGQDQRAIGIDGLATDLNRWRTNIFCRKEMGGKKIFPPALRSLV